MQHSHSNDDTCFSIDVINEVSEEELDALLNESDPFMNTFEKINETDLDREFAEFMEVKFKETCEGEAEEDFKELYLEEKFQIKNSIQDPPTDLDMKPLPSRLEYAYLKKDSLLPVIIASNLKADEKERLVCVLKNHKEASAWKTSDIPSISSDFCIKAFETLKEKLTNAPILVSPDWSLPFELMCDVSDFAVGAVLGQRKGKHFHPIHFARKTLNKAQQNYTVTEKELFAVLFAFGDFRSYLVLSKTVVFTDHSTLKYMFDKPVSKTRLIRYILLLQEFDIEIRNKKGVKNVAADHLSRLENPNFEKLREYEIDDNFMDGILMKIENHDEETSWFADFANYLVGNILRKGLIYAQHCKFFSDLKNLFKLFPGGMIRRCLHGAETQKILDECHHGPTEGYYGPSTTTKKVFDAGFYWLTIFKEAHTLVQNCDACQRSGSLSR
ncbi:reverse transcriptase domain-containing protein [Tanacetum coccineum]